MPLTRRLKADLSLGFISFIWGATFVVIKSALTDVSPLVFILLRFALASLLLLILLRRRASLRQAGLVKAGALVGFFLCAGYIFQTVGLLHTTATKSAFITALSVALVPLTLVVVLRRRLGAGAVVGAGLAVVGLYFLTVPAGELTMARGDLITFVCALAFAAHIVAVGHYAPRFGYAGLAVSQVGAAFVVAAVVLPLAAVAGWEIPRLVWTPRVLGALVVTAVFATALAFAVQSWAQQFTSPTHTAILYSLEPVFAALTSYVVFAERLSGRGWLGAGLILAGVLVAELRGPAAPDMPGMAAPANPLKKT